MVQNEDKVKGSVYGLAFGDAWGFITEFHMYDKIISVKPSPPEVLLISDDTQMSLYNIYAIQNIEALNIDLDALVSDELSRNVVRREFASEHLRFAVDQDNDRAPGNACMTSLANYRHRLNPVTGREGALGNDSKGCGANMRAPWLGLLGYSHSVTASLAVIQAETTHDHALAGVVSAVTALMVKDLFEGTVVPSGDGGLLEHASQIVRNLMDGSYGWVSWEKKHDDGLVELAAVLANASSRWAAFAASDHDVDVNKFFGEGWVAEEALVNAVAVADLYHDAPYEGTQRLVFTNGDSDSIAAIGGAMLGAVNGYEKLGVDVVNHLEPRYFYEIEEVAQFIESKVAE